ncbi:M23 family metallopeptidase [Pseudomonadales bacterium]|nr:M23 family metallopeptidase [Pseudomonadales bacterium]
MQMTIRQIAMSSLAALYISVACLNISFAWASPSTVEPNTASLNFTVTGDLKQGGLLIGQLDAGSTIYYKDRPLPVTADGRFIIGLDRDAPSLISLKIISADQSSSKLHELKVAPRDYAIQRIEGVAKQYVSPDPAQVKRSRKESAMVRAARKQQRQQKDFLDGFIWPAKGPISGVFGSQRVYNGEPRRPHYGVDVAAPVGTPVIAPAAGLVTLAEPDLFFSGGTLIVDHGHGLSSTFLHLSKLLVAPGDTVEQGDAIAEIGATGRVTGPHLDWRMNWTHGKHSVRIDPQLLVAVNGNEKK